MDYRQRTTVMAVAGWAIPDNGLQTTRLLLRQDYKSTRLRDNKWAVAGGCAGQKAKVVRQKEGGSRLLSFAFRLSTAKPQTTTTNMEHTEIKRYTKKELALLYFPNSSPETARRHLIRWIMRNSKLMEELYAANYNLYDQYLTKEQVEIIFRYIGPP